MKVVDLSQRRPPVHYTIRITHHWDGRIEALVEDVQDDARSREAVADAFARLCTKWLTPDHVREIAADMGLTDLSGGTA